MEGAFTAMKIMIINGPNLNMLGIREKGVYGSRGFEEVCRDLQQEGQRRGHELTLFQSNSEGAIIDAIHRAYFERYDGIVINPGAYTHYSYAIYDALKAISPIPAVEVHLSDIHAREEFRRVSVTAPACIAQIAGHGEAGYLMAIERLEQWEQPSAGK